MYTQYCITFHTSGKLLGLRDTTVLRRPEWIKLVQLHFICSPFYYYKNLGHMNFIVYSLSLVIVLKVRFDSAAPKFNEHTHVYCMRLFLFPLRTLMRLAVTFLSPPILY